MNLYICFGLNYCNLLLEVILVYIYFFTTVLLLNHPVHNQPNPNNTVTIDNLVLKTREPKVSYPHINSMLKMIPKFRDIKSNKKIQPWKTIALSNKKYKRGIHFQLKSSEFIQADLIFTIKIDGVISGFLYGNLYRITNNNHPYDVDTELVALNKVKKSICFLTAIEQECQIVEHETRKNVFLLNWHQNLLYVH